MVRAGERVKKSRATLHEGSEDRGPLSLLTILRQQSLDHEQRLTAALASCHDGLLVVDRDGRITHANDAAEGLLSSQGTPLTGTTTTDAFWRIVSVEDDTSPQRGPALLERIRDAEGFDTQRITVERADGARVHLDIEAAPVLDENEILAGMVIRLIDQGREEGTAAPRDGKTPRAGGDRDPIRGIVGSIANDFNNILTAILGNISLARTEVDREDEIYKTLTYVEKAAQRARDLSLRLLELASPDAIPAPADAEPEGEAIRGTGRLLVMDDEEMVRHVASRILTYLGYAVDTAAHGDHALAMYAEALAAGRPYRAVIMDLTVAGGMGGQQAIAELLKIDPAARAIVSTGYVSDPIMTDHRRHGFRGAIVKPYEIRRLGAAVHQVLEEPA